MPKKILIIDDSPTTLGALKSILEKEGYSVLTAKDGEEGLAQFKTKKPDLVIIDTLLPGIDGFEVCEKIKTSGEKHLPKLVLMTGSVDAIDAVKARKKGADDYIVKTSDLSPLANSINALMEKSR